MSALNEAKRKITKHNFAFNDLPLDRIDPIWSLLLNEPFYFSIQELSALKNARIPPPPPSGMPSYYPLHINL